MKNITKEFIENFVFSWNNFADELVRKNIYDKLAKKYNTNYDWLDDTYFKYQYEFISCFNLNELIYFTKEAKKILREHSLKYSISFESLYFSNLRDTLDMLFDSEPCKLSKKFKKSKRIKEFFIKELEPLVWKISNDKTKVTSIIDSLRENI